MEMPKQYTECAFNLKRIGTICSDEEGIKIMEKVLENLGGNVRDKSNEEIVKDLDKELKCDGIESCIYVSPEFTTVAGRKTSNRIKKKIFKPAGPWNSTEWLSNFNIDEVLSQWRDIYPGFVHIPYQMRDFEKQKKSLADVDLANEYRKGMKLFAVVFNTDFLSGNGEHWFCVFGDFSSDPITLEYFNSSGSLPLSEIHNWLHKTKADLEKKLNKKVKIVIVSRNEIQKSNSECGVFVLWYIYSRLNDVPYSYFSKVGSVTDQQMYEFRKHLYRRNK